MVYSYCLNYSVIDCNGSCNGVIACPTPTPSPTETLTPTPTNTGTPTPTPSFTPSASPIGPTPTPTNTGTPTPTNTNTPTPTPTNTNTPSPTPTATKIIIPQKPNECEPITLLPVGVSCLGNNPTNSSYLNGSICLQITGGTAPYSIYWFNNGQLITNQNGICIYGLSAGTYSSVVTDYYKDFTANTSCTLTSPIIPTSTPSPTPTQTLSPSYEPLCMTIECGKIAQWTFNPSINYMNGKPTWTGTGDASNYYISWDTSVSPNRWYVNGFNTFDIISNVSSIPPISGWYTVGSQNVVTVTSGECDGEVPIQFHTVTTNPTCQGENNGSISVIVDCGNSPFQFSIDGINYVNNSIFTGLNSGTYNVYVKNASSTVSQTVNLTSGGQGVTYILDLQYQTQQISNGIQITTFNVIVKDGQNNIINLPVGTTVTFDLVIDDTFNLYTPGDGNNLSNTFEIKKNGVTQNTSYTSNSNSTTTRPDCINQNIISTNNLLKYSLSMSNNDVISGTVLSSLVITNPQIINNCGTLGVDNINIYLDNVNKNCTCCEIQENAEFSLQNTIEVDEPIVSCPNNYIYRITNTSANPTDVQYFTSCSGPTIKVMIYNMLPGEIILTDGVTIRPSTGQSYPCSKENSIGGILYPVTVELLSNCQTP